MKRYLTLIGVLFALLPLSAQAQQLYGVSLNGHTAGDPGPSSLYVIDPATGAGTLIGDMGYAVNAIAVDPTTGILYASTTAWSGDFNGLLQVDPTTGAATEIGAFGLSIVVALTFDSSGQLWGWTEDGDDPVTIDKTTGAATVVGNAGISTAQQVMAFNPSDVLYLVQGTEVFIIDQVSGAANSQGNLGFDPGAGGADFDSAGVLWASRERGLVQDAWIRLTDIDGDSFTDIDTDVEYLNALTWGDVAADPRATFEVNKDFDDDNTASVEVTISCNTGLPLEQTTEIEEGDGVEFVVVDFNDGEMDCEITEVVPDGYSVTYAFDETSNDTGCVFENIEHGNGFICDITNSLDQVEVEVTKVWIDENPEFNAQNVAGATWSCSDVAFPCPEGDANGCDGGSLHFDGDLSDNSFSVFPDWEDGTTCSVTEVNLFESGIEVDDSECQGLVVFPGAGASCTIFNTRLFEGIPTLSQYGLGILALLMLGMGLVAYRRFV